MRFTKKQVAAEKEKAVAKERSKRRRLGGLIFLFGMLVGSGFMFAHLKPEKVVDGYNLTKNWVSHKIGN
jgi:hypothetical protein